MTTIDADKLENCIGDVLRQVRQAGETVEVVDHGQVLARVVPVTAHSSTMENTEFWDDMERLAQEIGKHTGGSMDAVELLREVRN